MADVFTQKTIAQGGMTDVEFDAIVKVYLDTLTATKIDTISYVPMAHTMKCIIVSHA